MGGAVDFEFGGRFRAQLWGRGIWAGKDVSKSEVVVEVVVVVVVVVEVVVVVVVVVVVEVAAGQAEAGAVAAAEAVAVTEAVARRRAMHSFTVSVTRCCSREVAQARPGCKQQPKNL